MSPALHSACSFLVASFNGTTIPMLDMSDSSTGSSNTRTLWDIIWSCAVTLFACAWTAIHPNIPGMDEGKVAIFSRRLLIMAIVLIAPEFIIAWAMRQFLSARRTANEFDDILGAQLLQAQAHHQNIGDGNTATLLSEMAELERNSLIPNPPRVASRKFRAWTVTHGFFACMGGFLLYVNDEPRAPLAPDELWRFVRKGSVDMPTIVEADIEDRSKGDILSKGIAILQLVWFVISLAARYAQNLPITLLEIDTLAIAALTCIVYSLWWKKPKDVGRPFPVHWKKMEPSPPSDLVYGEASVEDGYFLYFIRNLLNTESQFSHRAAHSRGASSLGGYYHATTDGFDDDDTVVLLIGCFSGMIFGVIHCAGWNFLFQRHTELILWRVASLVMLCAMISTSLCYGYTIFLQESRGCLPRVLAPFFGVALILSICSYFIARCTIIILILCSFLVLVELQTNSMISLAHNFFRLRPIIRI